MGNYLWSRDAMRDHWKNKEKYVRFSSIIINNNPVKTYCSLLPVASKRKYETTIIVLSGSCEVWILVFRDCGTKKLKLSKDRVEKASTFLSFSKFSEVLIFKLKHLMPYSLHRDTILIGTVGGEFSFYYLYSITVWSAAPQTTMWGGPRRAEIWTWDGRSRGTDT